MTDDSPDALTETPAASELCLEELAARLAARLCHDFISPASAIVSGLDLLDDPTAKDMREEAMDLIASSARKLGDMLQFARVAFGASAQAESFDSAELERLAKGVYAHVRAELDWKIESQTFAKPAARALLNLVQLCAGALPIGGIARAEARTEAGGPPDPDRGRPRTARATAAGSGLGHSRRTAGRRPRRTLGAGLLSARPGPRGWRNHRGPGRRRGGGAERHAPGLIFSPRSGLRGSGPPLLNQDLRDNGCSSPLFGSGAPAMRTCLVVDDSRVDPQGRATDPRRHRL